MAKLMKELNRASNRYKTLNSPSAKKALEKAERKVLDALNRDPYKKEP